MTELTTPSSEATDAPSQPGRRGRVRGPLLVTLVAGVVLVVGTIGPPLFGRGTLLPSDVLTAAYPWRVSDDPISENAGDHGPVGDTVDVIYPGRVAFADALKHRHSLGWNPFVVGGTALGSESGLATMSPSEIAYVVLPSWFAPAALKLVQMVVAIGFTFLFCRQLGAGRVPALFGGLAFAGSAFMLMWTNWPQPEVAALTPALFWATERFLQQPRVATAGPIALVLAVMILGNFPAVVGYALYVLAPYVIVRMALASDRSIRRRLTAVIGAGTALVTGAALVAAVLIPFATRLTYIGTDARRQNPSHHLSLETVLTAAAPKALGLSTEGPTAQYFGPFNQVETISFVGITTIVLALACVALPRLRSTPPGAREVLAAATVVIGWATYVGGDLLRLFQRLPVFTDNFVGRTRSVLGFTVAVLAALGLEALARRVWPSTWRQWEWVAVVGVAAAVTAAYTGNRALWRARGPGQVDVLGRELVLPALVGVGAVATLSVVRFAPRRTAALGLAAVPMLLVVESLDLSLPLLPNEDPDHLYPTTPGVDYLASHAAGDRVAVQGLGLYGGGATVFGFRSATGHGFNAPTWKQAISTADPNAFAGSPTFAFLAGTPKVMTSPVLDRLAATWYAGSPETPPPGRRDGAAAKRVRCNSTTRLADHVNVPVAAAGGLRAIVVRVCEAADVPVAATLRADVAGTAGGVTSDYRATGMLPLPTSVPEGELAVALPAEDLRASGSANVRLSLVGAPGRALSLATTSDGRIATDVIRPRSDGLALVYAGDLRIYRRRRALPRFHWAGRATVVTDADERLTRLAAGDIPDDTVVLSRAGARGSGASGQVTVTRDAPTSMAATVDAQGDGYLVIADALQSDWSATVDGVSADLVDADHADVAVHVAEGHHVIEVRYTPRGQRAGIALSGASAIGLAGAWVRDSRRRRRDRVSVGPRSLSAPPAAS